MSSPPGDEPVRGDDPDEAREIEARLREIPVPGPRGEWRRGLRDHFVTNGSPDAVGVRTQGVIETMLRRTPAPSPADDFRQELRSRFVSGDLPVKAEVEGQDEGALPELPGASVRRGPSPVRRSPRSTPRTRSRTERSAGRKFPLRPVLVGFVAAAAAALVLILGPWAGGDAPAWNRSDDRTLVGAVAVGEALEDVHLGDLLLRLRPGTEARFEAPRAEEALVHLDAGEVFVRTDPDYDGPALVVRTPDLDMRLTGTVLGVALLPGGGTCVCVHRGTAEVVEHEGGDAARNARIEAGERYVLWGNGKAYGEPLPEAEPHVGDLVRFSGE